MRYGRNSSPSAPGGTSTASSTSSSNPTPGAIASRYQRRLPAADSITPIRCQRPGTAWQKACSLPSGSTVGPSVEAKTTPEVPREWESESDNDDDDASEEDEDAAPRPQKKTPSAKKIKEAEDKAKALKKFEKTRSRAQSRTAFRLQMVRKKERELVAAEEELEKQRAKMNSSVGGVNKNGVKFKIRERKR